MKILSLVGARPQFVKEAMLGSAVREQKAWDHVLVHSGQHYDVNMSDVFFQELGIPSPAVHLGIGSGSHAAMTAADFVVTDSSGPQNEACYAGKRCVVIMPDTGWRELTDAGWNLLADAAAASLAACCEEALSPMPQPANVYGDGRAARYIIGAVRHMFV